MYRFTIPIVVAVFAISAGCKRKPKGPGDSSVCPLGCVTKTISLGGVSQTFAMADGHVYSCQGSSVDSDIVKAALDGSNSEIAHIRFGCLSMAADDTSVYWFTTGETLMSVPVGGGTAATIASGNYNGRSLTAKAGTLYWVDSKDNGSILSMPSAGGTVTTLSTGLTYPSRLSVDDTHVYAVTNRNDRSGPYDVVSVPLAGGTTTTLVTERVAITGVASDGASVYWVTGTSMTPGAVASAPIAGGSPVLLAATGGPTAPYLNGDELIWGDEFGEGIVRLPLNGGNPVTLFTPIYSSCHLVSDGENHYAWEFVISDPEGMEPTRTDFYSLTF